MPYLCEWECRGRSWIARFLRPSSNVGGRLITAPTDAIERVACAPARPFAPAAAKCAFAAGILLYGFFLLRYTVGRIAVRSPADVMADRIRGIAYEKKKNFVAYHPAGLAGGFCGFVRFANHGRSYFRN